MLFCWWKCGELTDRFYRHSSGENLVFGKILFSTLAETLPSEIASPKSSIHLRNGVERIFHKNFGEKLSESANPNVHKLANLGKFIFQTSAIENDLGLYFDFSAHPPDDKQRGKKKKL